MQAVEIAAFAGYPEEKYEWASDPVTTSKSLPILPDFSTYRLHRSMSRPGPDCFANLFLLAMLLGVWWSLTSAVGLFVACYVFSPLSLGTVLFLSLPLVILLGHTSRCFHVVFNAAANGERGLYVWPGFSWRDLVHGGRAVLGFLAGPFFVAALAVWFWVHSGRTTLVDALIILELASVACGWWLLTLVVPRVLGSWTAIQPSALGQWIASAEWMAYLATILAAIASGAIVTCLLVVFAAFLETFIIGVFFCGFLLVPSFLAFFFLVRGLGLRQYRRHGRRDRILLANADC